MKKILLVILSLLLSFSLISCSRGATVSEPGTSETEDVFDIEYDSTTESKNVTVVFPEGFSVVQIGERLEENGVCTLEDFLTAMGDTSYAEENLYAYVNDIALKENTPFLYEGYLFPATYDFVKGESVSGVIKKMLGAFTYRFGSEEKQQAADMGFTVDEIVTLASIIEKESSPDEMAKVSSVFHNRLKASYNRLESDATINYLNRYVIPNIDGDTERYNEFYNTYKCYGLPQGPICNPGWQAITAALNPEDTDYLFFVSDSEGKYYYSKTYEEHLEICKELGY